MKLVIKFICNCLYWDTTLAMLLLIYFNDYLIGSLEDDSFYFTLSTIFMIFISLVRILFTALNPVSTKYEVGKGMNHEQISFHICGYSSSGIFIILPKL